MPQLAAAPLPHFRGDPPTLQGLLRPPLHPAAAGSLLRADAALLLSLGWSAPAPEPHLLTAALKRSPCLDPAAAPLGSSMSPVCMDHHTGQITERQQQKVSQPGAQSLIESRVQARS